MSASSIGAPCVGDVVIELVAQPVFAGLPARQVDTLAGVALITYFGSRQAVGVTVPRINLKSVEIPLLDPDFTKRLDVKANGRQQLLQQSAADCRW